VWPRPFLEYQTKFKVQMTQRVLGVGPFGDVVRGSCPPLAFADLSAAQLWQAGALAQAGTAMARLLKYYGEQVRGERSSGFPVNVVAEFISAWG
jgi:hypothetical protein